MSDLKRKYDGLKQAHKELSEEVVGLREQNARFFDDISRHIDVKMEYRKALENCERELKKFYEIPLGESYRKRIFSIHDITVEALKLKCDCGWHPTNECRNPHCIATASIEGREGR